MSPPSTVVPHNRVRRVPVVVLLLMVGMTARGAAAQPNPTLPGQLQQFLEQAGVFHGGRTLPFGDWRAVLQPPVRNAEFADLMSRARRDDVVVPLTHSLFAPEHGSEGHWHSAFDLANYGTAILLAAPFAEKRVPVVLLPGINGTARDFADLVPRLQAAGYQPIYFIYPSGMALGEASRQLAARLVEFFGRHEVESFAVIGHSMGGLVGKGALDELTAHDGLPNWRLFVSISSPFGGVDSAQYADRLPQRPPAWQDLAHNSGFLQKIRSTPFPSETSFYLFFGARSSQPLMAALGNNDGVLTVKSMVDPSLSGAARDVFGFYEDHTSILSAPLVFRRLDTVLQTELRADQRSSRSR